MKDFDPFQTKEPTDLAVAGISRPEPRRMKGRSLELENLLSAAEEELREEAAEALARAKARYGLTD